MIFIENRAGIPGLSTISIEPGLFTNVANENIQEFIKLIIKQIKPKILNGRRRYYDKETVELLKRIHFLLKEQGMTLNGVKKILDKKEFLKLDETLNQSIKAQDLKLKIKNISKLINNLKR